MNSIRLFDRRVVYIVAAFAMLVATFVPALVSAAQVTERSIRLTSAAAGATNVGYQVNFKADAGAADADAFVVEFCKNSPVVRAECTAVGDGFTAAGAASTDTDVTAVTGATNKVTVTSEIVAGENVSVDLTNITNPTVSGPLYARIITYDTVAHATAYTSENLGDGVIDEGGIALYINDRIGVSGAVQETLTFCIAKNAISDNCDLTGNAAPILKLGEEVVPGDSSTLALEAGVVSEDSLHTQISTNAVSGAVINLKNSVTCGGMKRANVSTCDIAPALQTGISANSTTAKFGVKTNTATNGTDGTGELQPVTGSGYSNSAYALNYINTNLTGVTSVYGDPFLDTNNALASNKNMEITFGATVTNTTPAGTYSADLSMIATGKF